MKTISGAFEAHLALEVTTLCTCWRIIRTDGEVFGFTDHDRDIDFGGITYESETGYNRTAISSDSSLSVDNLDVTGFLESDRISENDLRNGLFDHAKVFIFALNWADTTMGSVPLRRGWFGEVVLNQNGTFETEIRGLHQALSHNFMESYQPECRADFCDTRCKLIYDNYVRASFAFAPKSRSQFYVSQGAYIPPDLSVGAHRYWRITPTAWFNPLEAVSFAEVRFWDQDDALIVGGTATAQSQFSGSYSAAKARDGNGGTLWSADGGATHWWKIDFGAGNAKDISRMELQARNDGFAHQTPIGFNLEYSDDDVAWTVASNYSSIGAYTAGEVRPFAGFGGTQSGTAPDAPFAGAETYIGGTIKFTSGPNTGKIIEIVDFDTTTGEVIVMEDFPYEVTQGDELELAQGCDKRFATCKLYDNQANFRGEPHVPGQDEYLKYPDSHD